MRRSLVFLLTALIIVGNLHAIAGTRSIVELKGPWEFHPGSHISADSAEWAIDKRLVKLPESWNSLSWPEKPAGQPDGLGTYRILLELDPDQGPWALDWRLAGTAARIWWQDKLIHQAGVPGNNAATEIAGNHPALLNLNGGKGWLVIQVSNYRHVDGGLWSPLRLGPLDMLQLDNQRSAGLEWFLAGAFILLGLLGIGIMLVLSREPASLWFGLLTLILGVRILFHGQLDILQLFPDLDFEWFNKVRHYTMYLLPLLLMSFLDVIMPRHFPRRFKLFVELTSLAGILVVTILPYRWYGNLLYPFAPIILFEVAVALWFMIKSLRRDNPVVICATIGIIVIIVANILDLTHFVFLIELPNIVPLASMIMLLLLAMALGLHLARTKTAHETLNRQFSGIKHSLERFFPTEFLSLLKRESLADLELGHAVSMEMAVLFVDIRSFSTITQDMKPEDIFGMINSFLGSMGPIIRQHGGFVDKYLGDGIMAIFPAGGAAAVDAGIAMHAAIPGLNAIHRLENIPELSIGVGIHQGPLLLGTIGEAERMASTVISSVVNLASRLEALTRDYRSPIIVSPAIIMSLPPDSYVEYRFLGHEHIRGFDHPLPIFEIYNPDPVDIRLQKAQTKAEFEDSLIHFGKGEFREAAKVLLAMRKRCPGDPAPATYLDRIRVIQEKRIIYRFTRNRLKKSNPSISTEPDTDQQHINLFTAESLLEIE